MDLQNTNATNANDSTCIAYIIDLQQSTHSRPTQFSTKFLQIITEADYYILQDYGTTWNAALILANFMLHVNILHS